jgi:hypothetical protein
VVVNIYVISTASQYPTISCALLGCFDVRGLISIDILVFEVILIPPALIALFWPGRRTQRKTSS